jgi:uncharacterized protein YjbJ (UPF0337 family)
MHAVAVSLIHLAAVKMASCAVLLHRFAAGKGTQEGVGAATGDARTQFKGKLDQAAGAVQDLYGQTADAAGDRQLVSANSRDTTLHNGARRAWCRLVAGQDASPVLKSSMSEPLGRLIFASFGRLSFVWHAGISNCLQRTFQALRTPLQPVPFLGR